jgi:hypothetical protein
VQISGYHSDNGVFKAEFEGRTLKGQGIKFSGVGTKWQNGVAENTGQDLLT